MGMRVVTVNDVLEGHVALDVECLDRIYLIEGVRDARLGGDPAQPTAEAHQCAGGPEDSPDPVQ